MLERLTGNSYYNFPVYAYGDGRRYVHVPRNMARDVADLRWINTECSWAARERGIVLLPVETWMHIGPPHHKSGGYGPKKTSKMR
jgi:hypothetical protein